MTSCVILAELIFAAGVLNQKRKIFKSKQKLTREKGKERNKEKKEFVCKRTFSKPRYEDVAKQKI